jgi:hypothetical protein
VQGSEVRSWFWVLGSGFSVLGARCWIRWRILTSLQVLAEPCGAADGAIGELEEFLRPVQRSDT